MNRSMMKMTSSTSSTSDELFINDTDIILQEFVQLSSVRFLAMLSNETILVIFL